MYISITSVEFPKLEESVFIVDASYEAVLILKIVCSYYSHLLSKAANKDCF